MTPPPPVLGALDPDRPLPFGRDSLVRAAVAEPVTALLVQRALVMDVAHPDVAAAVAQHSQFKQHPLSRAWVTVDAALRLVFGDERVARGAARQIYDVHDHINGHVARSDHRDDGGDARAGDGDGAGDGAGDSGDDGHIDGDADSADDSDGEVRRYTAHDASLLAWVWATLVDTTETAFTRWVRPFDSVEATAFYVEMRSFARFMGIPDDLLPVDRGAFSSYLEDMLDSEDFGTSQESRALARDVLWFEHRVVPSPVVRLERVLALATLDPRLVDRLEIHPDRADAELGAKLDAWLGSYYRRLPRPPRVLPPLYVFMRRPSIGLARRARAVMGTVGRVTRS